MNQTITSPLKLSLLAVSILLAAAPTPVATAQEQPKQGKPSETEKNAMKAKADLHERIAKAHKNAAKCLKDGKKPETECTTQLTKECESTGASMQCMPKPPEGMAGKAASNSEP